MKICNKDICEVVDFIDISLGLVACSTTIIIEHLITFSWEPSVPLARDVLVL